MSPSSRVGQPPMRCRWARICVGGGDLTNVVRLEKKRQRAHTNVGGCDFSVSLMREPTGEKQQQAQSQPKRIESGARISSHLGWKLQNTGYSHVSRVFPRPGRKKRGRYKREVVRRDMPSGLKTRPHFQRGSGSSPHIQASRERRMTMTTQCSASASQHECER